MASLHQWLLLPLLIICLFSNNIIQISSATQLFHKLPRLGVTNRNNPSTVSKALDSDDFLGYFYNQTLDHFNFNPKSYAKFKQFYVLNSKYWGGAKSKSPIFVYLGPEAGIEGIIPSVGFLLDIAPRFKALLVYLEHRFYGRSNPVGSMEKSLENEEIRGYFSSAQALADYAEILLHLKRNLSANHSPLMVFGGSYGGMLATWFRLKYPHIAMGALASSAPILYFDNLTPQSAFHSIITKDFKDASENCYKTIKESWSIIDKFGSQPKALTSLSRKFKTCNNLNTPSDLSGFLLSTYVSSAQYDAPPTYPVKQFCKGVDEAPKGSGVLDRIFAGVVSLKGNLSCYDIGGSSLPTETVLGWKWQTCSEMTFPIGSNSSETMLPDMPFVLSNFVDDCKNTFGVPPRLHWIPTNYGGPDMKLVFKRFGSNIIFSNGLRDPFSAGGVLENLSTTLLAVYTKEGSHCLDLTASDKSDPAWLVAQRKAEVKIMKKWIKSYYADLASTSSKEAMLN